jgi:hypothetical protein
MSHWVALLSGSGADAAAQARYQEQLAEWKQRREALRKQRKEARKARAAASAHADEERAASDSSDDRSEHAYACLQAEAAARDVLLRRGGVKFDASSGCSDIVMFLLQ